MPDTGTIMFQNGKTAQVINLSNADLRMLVKTANRLSNPQGMGWLHVQPGGWTTRPPTASSRNTTGRAASTWTTSTAAP